MVLVLIGVLVEYKLKAVLVYMECHTSVYVVWSGQGRDNLGTTLGQGRDNPIVVFVKNGSFYVFRARFGANFKFDVTFDFR